MNPAPPVTRTRTVEYPSRPIRARRTAARTRPSPTRARDRPDQAGSARRCRGRDRAASPRRRVMPGCPLDVEAVEVLATRVGDRLEAVAHAGRNQHLDARPQSPVTSVPRVGDPGARRGTRRTPRRARRPTSLVIASPCRPRSPPRFVQVMLTCAHRSGTGTPAAANALVRKNSRTVPRSSIATFGVIRHSPAMAVSSADIGMISALTAASTYSRCDAAQVLAVTRVAHPGRDPHRVVRR